MQKPGNVVPIPVPPSPARPGGRDRITVVAAQDAAFTRC